MALDKLRAVRRTFMRRLRGPTLLSFGHATEGGVAGAGSDGVIGVGADFGTRFLAFALLAGFAFFIAFFLRDAPPRFAFLDFFATFNLPNRITKICNGITP